MTRRFSQVGLISVVLLALCQQPALADEAGYRAPTASVQLEYGAAYRDTTLAAGPALAKPPQVRQGTDSSIRGFSPNVIRLRADVFPFEWAGLEFEGLLDVFSTRLPASTDPAISAADGGVALTLRTESRVGITARYSTASGFTVSGSIGMGVVGAPVRQVIERTALPESLTMLSFGPAFRVGANATFGKLDLALNVSGTIGLGGYGVKVFQPGLQVAYRLFELNGLGLSALFHYEAALEPPPAKALSDPPGGYSGHSHRFALGLRLDFLPPPSATPLVDPAQQPPRVLVTVKLPSGEGAVGAKVSLDAQEPLVIAEQGSVLLTPSVGAHQVRVVLTGHRVVTRSITATLGTQTDLPVTLEVLSGPGSLKGVVTAVVGTKPVEGALVTSGSQQTKTDANGAYQFASLGPGPVNLRFEAQGFNTASEVAQVPAEAEATLDVALEPLGKGSPATVRGLIRARTGEPLSNATVVIKGRSTKVAVDAEGRFVVTIPGGEYFFTISAPGYAPQTKKVTLADGDQAIFHSELQKVTK